MEFEISTAFPTIIGRWRVPDAGHSPRIAVSFNAAVAGDQAAPSKPSSADALQPIESGA